MEGGITRFIKMCSHIFSSFSLNIFSLNVNMKVFSFFFGKCRVFCLNDFLTVKVFVATEKVFRLIRYYLREIIGIKLENILKLSSSNTQFSSKLSSTLNVLAKLKVTWWNERNIQSPNLEHFKAISSIHTFNDRSFVKIVF